MTTGAVSLEVREKEQKKQNRCRPFFLDACLSVLVFGFCSQCLFLLLFFFPWSVKDGEMPFGPLVNFKNCPRCRSSRVDNCTVEWGPGQDHMCCGGFLCQYGKQNEAVYQLGHWLHKSMVECMDILIRCSILGRVCWILTYCSNSAGWNVML
jgi:hypothetical protein